MDTLAPDIARKLLSRDLANLAQRIQRGEKLSKAERVMLQNMAARAGETPAVAGDFSELARILQISRRTMNRWRKHPDAPPPGHPIYRERGSWGTHSQSFALAPEEYVARIAEFHRRALASPEP